MQPYKDDAMLIKLLKHRSQPDPTVVEMDKNKYYVSHLWSIRSKCFSDLCGDRFRELVNIPFRLYYYKFSIICNNSLFGLTQITFHFVSINHIKGSENTFFLLVFSASKDLSAVSLPTEDLPIL